MLDQAFDTLKTYQWGDDRKTLDPIDQAIVDSQGNATERTQLERRLVALLAGSPSAATVDFVCRKLMQIGTDASVSALAKLLSAEKHSHMARYALERIPATEAAGALREALKTVDDSELKIGIISSLGVRQDDESVPLLADLLTADNHAVAVAAAHALGAIQTPAAAESLVNAEPSEATLQRVVADAALACAEARLDHGEKAAALKIYRSLAGGEQPRHIRLAVTRGILACAGS